MADSTKNSYETDQGEFTGRFCARPQNFAWFLGADASATAGPTAKDLLWDMKRLRYYSRDENQDLYEAVRTKIRSVPQRGAFSDQDIHLIPGTANRSPSNGKRPQKSHLTRCAVASKPL